MSSFAAQSLAELYEAIANGWNGADTAAANAAGWGAPLEQIAHVMDSAAMNARQRQQQELAYRAAMAKSMLDFRAREERAAAIDYYRNRADELARDKLAQQYQLALDREVGRDRREQGRLGLGPARLNSGPMKGGKGGATVGMPDREAVLRYMVETGQLGLIDLPTVRAQMDAGGEELPETTKRNYLEARRRLAEDTLQARQEQQAADKGPKRNMGDETKVAIQAAKGMSPANKDAFAKAYVTGDYAAIREIPGGPELMDKLQKAPNEKTNKKAAPGPQTNAGSEQSWLDRQAGLLQKGGQTNFGQAAMMGLEPILERLGLISPQGGGSPQPSAGENQPVNMMGYHGGLGGNTPVEQMPQGANRDARYVRDPNTGAWTEEALDPSRGQKSDWGQAMTLDDMRRLDRTDIYGRKLGDDGVPLTVKAAAYADRLRQQRMAVDEREGMGFPLGQSTTKPKTAYATAASFLPSFGGSPLDKYMQSRGDIDTNRFQSFDRPEPGLSEGFTRPDIFAGLLAGIPGVARGIAGLGARKATGEAATSYMGPGSRPVTAAANRGYMAPGQQIVRSPRVPSTPPPLTEVPHPAPFPRYMPPEGPASSLPGPGRMLELPPGSDFALHGPRSSWVPTPYSVAPRLLQRSLPPGTGEPPWALQKLLEPPINIPVPKVGPKWPWVYDFKLFQ